MYPAGRETMVSVLCLFGREGIYLSSSRDLPAQRNQIFVIKLIFIIHVVTFLWMAVGFAAV
jgi:hypothetical protein